MTESSDSFQTTEPPAPIPQQPKRRKRGLRILLIGIVAAVVVAGLGAGAWWAITTHNELNDTRADLEATQGQLAVLQAQSSDQITEIAELESQSAGLQSNLDDRTTALAGLQTEHDQLTADHEQLTTESAALTAANGGLREAIDSMSLDLDRSRDMTAVVAVYMMAAAINPRLSDEVQAVLDELAAEIGWFDKTDDFDLSGSLAWTRFTSAIDDLDDQALTEAFHTFADSSYGSQEMIDSWAEWIGRFFNIALDTIDQALETGEAALAE